MRSFLAEEGYAVDAEAMVKEDGKYYPMMRVRYAPQRAACGTQREIFSRYGRLLLAERNPVLLDYLKKERRVQEETLEKLSAQSMTARIAGRMEEVARLLRQNAEAMAYWDKTESEMEETAWERERLH